MNPYYGEGTEDFTILNVLQVQCHQSVYSDGTYLYTTQGGSTYDWAYIYKYDMEGNQLASNLAAGDVTGNPNDIRQVNGMSMKDGVLYVSSMNYLNSPPKSWIVEYDATDLSFIRLHSVGDPTEAQYSEGCDYAFGYWFVCFNQSQVIERYSVDANGDWVFEERHPIPHVTNNWPGYESIFFAGKYAYLNKHAGQDPMKFACWRWDGVESGFTLVAEYDQVGRYVESLDRVQYCRQGVCREPGTNKLWWADRRGETADNYAVFTTVNSFNLEEFNTGVQRTDTGVVKTLTNGAVISV